MKNKKLLFVIFAIVATALAVVAVLVRGPAPTEPGPAGSGEMSRGPNHDPFADPFFQNKGAAGYNDFQQDLQSYVEYARYPPLSRPLKPDMKHLLSPNLRYETWEPAGVPPGEDEDWTPPYHFLLTADRYFLTGDETIIFTMQGAAEADAESRPVKLVIREASVHPGLKKRKDDARKVADLKFEWNQEQRRYTATLQPASVTGLANYAGPVRLRVRYGAEGTAEQNPASLVFEYYPEKKIPARFTGNFREDVEEGSLVIRAEIQVRRAGWYNIDANLSDRSDVPIGFARYKGELKKGIQEVPIQFFGKVIRDREGESPFRVHGLRGFLALEPKPGEKPENDGGRLVVPIYEGEFKTRPYEDETVFSNAEWDHPTKKMRIDFLREQAAGQ